MDEKMINKIIKSLILEVLKESIRLMTKKQNQGFLSLKEKCILELYKKILQTHFKFYK